MFPSLQEIFRDSLHNRVSRRSPSNFRVSESLREFPESPGVFLAARPSLREVSGQNRTLQESPSAPRVFQRPPAYKGFDFVDFLLTEGLWCVCQRPRLGAYKLRWILFTVGEA